VLTVYMDGLHYIYIFYACCIGTAFVMTTGVGNTYLKRSAPQEKAQSQSPEESEVEQMRSDISGRQDMIPQPTKAEV
jgi:hypothetical protein